MGSQSRDSKKKTAKNTTKNLEKKLEITKMIWGIVKDGGFLSGSSVMLPRQDSNSSMDVSSLSSESNDSFTQRRSSNFSDIIPYLDEETRDAVYYPDEDESLYQCASTLEQTGKRNKLFIPSID